MQLEGGPFLSVTRGRSRVDQRPLLCTVQPLVSLHSSTQVTSTWKPSLMPPVVFTYCSPTISFDDEGFTRASPSLSISIDMEIYMRWQPFITTMATAIVFPSHHHRVPGLPALALTSFPVSPFSLLLTQQPKGYFLNINSNQVTTLFKILCGFPSQNLK